GFRLLETNPRRALTQAETLLTKYSGSSSLYVHILQLKALALQAKGHFHEALPLFQSLYEKHSVSVVDLTTHGLALAKHLELMRSPANMKTALGIYTDLRAHVKPHRYDMDIELALCEHLQLMGGMDNLSTALNIYTQLRTLAAEGQVNTPCNDIELELALGKHLQLMGGMDNLKKALHIYTRLRALAATRQMPPAYQAKEIEQYIASILIDVDIGNGLTLHPNYPVRECPLCLSDLATKVTCSEPEHALCLPCHNRLYSYSIQDRKCIFCHVTASPLVIQSTE
ncbi:hypothetical protein, partial [Sansalvadorimonas verongulae]|uniref:hypothetical protein n=1 Tax=Sansalvadorimonas verongulae TaxID=2172824 RepID=UPI0018AD16E8